MQSIGVIQYCGKLCGNDSFLTCCFSAAALLKKREDINNRAADMWSYSVLLWELATREVPFADMSPMEIGMKVSATSDFYFRFESENSS